MKYTMVNIRNEVSTEGIYEIQIFTLQSECSGFGQKH